MPTKITALESTLVREEPSLGGSRSASALSWLREKPIPPLTEPPQDAISEPGKKDGHLPRNG
jgi:hypothetical protein